MPSLGNDEQQAGARLPLEGPLHESPVQTWDDADRNSARLATWPVFTFTRTRSPGASALNFPRGVSWLQQLGVRASTCDSISSSLHIIQGMQDHLYIASHYPTHSNQPESSPDDAGLTRNADLDQYPHLNLTCRFCHATITLPSTLPFPLHLLLSIN
jgi:hypothetical protein